MFLFCHFISCCYNATCAIIKIRGDTLTRKQRKEPCAHASSSAAVRPASLASRLSSAACHRLVVRGWCAAPGSAPVAFPSLQTSVANQIKKSLASSRPLCEALGPMRALVRHLGTVGSVLPSPQSRGALLSFEFSPLFYISCCSGREKADLAVVSSVS